MYPGIKMKRHGIPYLKGPPDTYVQTAPDIRRIMPKKLFSVSGDALPGPRE
jgi:hypothetical protein